MRRIILLMTVAIALVSNVLGQQYCGSQLNLAELEQTDPAMYQRFMALEEQTRKSVQNTRAIPTSTITIPVVVHVVYSNSSQNISDAQIQSQIQVLNEDYRRQNADRTNTPSAFAGVAGNANFEFKLARVDPNGNPTTGITRRQTSVSGFSANTDYVKFTSS